MSVENYYRKNPKICTPQKIAVIILKLKQYCFTTEYLIQKMQTKLPTV